MKFGANHKTLAGVPARGSCAERWRLRRLLPHFLAACSFVALVPHVHALTPQEIYQQVQQKVFVLELLNEKGTVLSAHTALLLDKGKAVTQCDLLEGAASFRLRQLDAIYPAKPGAKDIARNLCLLSAPDIPSSTPQHLRDSDPEVGVQVYALSNALGFGINITEGVVSGIRKFDGESSIQFTAAIAPGSEGGGLFDAKGTLVGIITYRKLDGQNVNFAFPARWLTEIEQRSTSTDAVETWRFKASALARESKWAELAEHASLWANKLNDSVEAWLWVGYANEQRKNWAAVEYAYRQVHQRDPASIQAGIGLVAALLSQNKPQDALDVGRAMLAYHQEDERIWRSVGYVETALNQIDAAKKSFTYAAKLGSWNGDAFANLADIARLQNDWPGAVSALQQFVRIDPQKVAAWIQLAHAYLNTERPERALASTEHAIALAPDDGNAWFIKGIALYTLGRYHEAIDTLKKAIANKPKQPALGWEWLGNTYRDQDLCPEAISAYREALQLKPGDGVIRGRLGRALKDCNQFDEALVLFEKLRADNLKDPFPWRQIGYVRKFLGQIELAIPAFEESLKLAPKQPEVWANLMEAYHAAGRLEDVKRAYQRLLPLDSAWAQVTYRELLLPYGVAP